MSPYFLPCVLCGFNIFDHENPQSASWLNQFRILYTSPIGISVTGVGIYTDDGEWIAPVDYTARWGDDGYEFQAHDKIGVLHRHPVDNRYGFPFHESCWSLLEHSYISDRIPCDRLFTVCQSLPFQINGIGLDWGHNYEGLYIENNSTQLPWEDRLVDQNIESPLFFIVQADPLSVPEIVDLLSHDPQAPPSLDISVPETTFANCFTKLPEEICMYIAFYLPTKDALTLRLACRSFVPIFYRQQFWASRFGEYGELSWLFESNTWKKTSDWRWIYRLINNIRSDGIQNRKRVWTLIQHMRKLLSLRLHEPLTSSELPLTPISDTVWREAAGDLRPQTSLGPYHGFSNGCRLFYKRRVSIPRLINRILFSTIWLGDTVYIAGMRVIGKNGDATELGYRAEMEEKEVVVLRNALLTGFSLAIGSRGIQGIQCIFTDGQTSPWIGSINNTPKSTRLIFSRPITAIEAGFDGCKMVSLAAVAEETCPMSLRKSAFWYPKPPEIKLYLNDDSFAATKTVTTRYQPLSWTSFGGPRGLYLRHLTRISVTNSVLDIGRIIVGPCYSSEYAKITNFAIDGPGGEVINAVEVYQRYPPESDNIMWQYKYGGVLESLKISTNFGRSYHFRQSTKAISTKIIKKQLISVPGSTLTGFYWSQHENRILSIGAISEKLHGND